MDPPAAELDEHEDVERPEPGGLDGEEVAGDDAIRLGPQELGPGRAGPPRGGPRSRSSEQGPYRRRADSDAELAELALDPHAAPARVLAGEAEDEGTELGIDRRPAKAARPAVGPLPAYELAVPAEEGCRGDEEGDPSITRDHPTRRREQDPVDGPELRSARRPLQHAKLMAEDEDLEVLASVVSALLATADEETDEGADDEVEEGQHRPIVPGLSERESGCPTPTGTQAVRTSAALGSWGSETRIRSRGGAVVRVDQPTEQIPSANVARTDQHRVRRFGSWRGEAEGAMGSPAVVVLDIGPERPIEMPEGFNNPNHAAQRYS